MSQHSPDPDDEDDVTDLDDTGIFCEKCEVSCAIQFIDMNPKAKVKKVTMCPNCEHIREH